MPGNTDDRDELRLVLRARASERVEQQIQLAPATDQSSGRLQVDVDAEERPR